MSGGDGGGFFDDAINSIADSTKGNFFEGIVNAGIQLGTAGMVGYKDGKLKKGAVVEVYEEGGKALASGTKEITGAKAAEEANKLAVKQFEEQKLAAEQDRATAIQNKGRDQLRLSNMAGTARSAGATLGVAKGNILGGSTEGDILGL